MNKFYKLLGLILLVALHFSCDEKKSSQKEVVSPVFVDFLKTDTLKFNSGIRAILQDSNGNYWFGSHKEGVGFYNGKIFQYFTTFNGLPNNQIRSIQEDTYGNICLVLQTV